MNTLSKLKPIENLSQVDKIEITLQEYFRNENFMPGDSIPKEVELADAMGVSRTAIREALTRFKLLGIIESKKNRGMIITQPDILGNMQRVLNSRLLDSETMNEIFEMRLVLEMGICELLFLKKNPGNLDVLEQIVLTEEKSTSKQEKLKCDVDFHSTLYKISGNKTIQRFQRMLLPIFDYVDNRLQVSKQQENASFVSHRVLLNTLRDGDVHDFRNKMHHHLMSYFEKIKMMNT
ncbi:FadR/GntR family transcriptional regulator [Parapedobacter soli]|uniref:FadR/GntR family transcriptional regulator n=1 Tax=Parapedobacter soli TaxID=416955 RepID=UPI0021CA0B92|nr:FCD domain-containing protein [Parapedobacter soli]